MSDSRPNILFITCHDLGRHLGCYGETTVVSPALDSLAATGLRFDSSYSTAPTCCPARAALHTGRYPHSTGMMGFLFDHFNWSLHDGERHLASYLQELGYATAQVGYQHVVPRERMDLRHSLGFDHVSESQPNPSADRVSTEAAKFLQEYRDDRPFYLEVGFFEAHTRWDRYPELGWSKVEDSTGVAVPNFLPDEGATRAQLGGFQSSIRKLDDGVGALLTALYLSGRSHDTWVIFVTDHGIPFPGAKGSLYDPGLEISLLMRWPAAGLAGGRVFGELVSNVDLVPTILEAVGGPSPDALQGRSFWPLLHDLPYEAREHVCAEMTFGIHYEPMRSVRTPRHKLIFIPEMSPSLGSETDGVFSPAFRHQLSVRPYHLRPIFELYDLATDPLERSNVAGSEAFAHIERELKLRLRAWMEETADPLLGGPVASPRYRKAMTELAEV